VFVMPSYASAAAVDILGTEDVGAASTLSGKRRSRKGKGGKSGGGGSGGSGGGGSGGGGGGGGGGGSGGGSGGSVAEVVAVVGVVVAVVAAVGVVEAAVMAVGVELFRGEVLAVARGSRSSVKARPLNPSSFVSGLLSVGRLGVVFAARMSGVHIFALDYDAILAAMYALSFSAEGDCYLSVPPDPRIEAATLGASESALPFIVPAEALHTFTLDSGAIRYFFRDSTTLTPLPAPVPVRLADPSGGPVLARSSTVLTCPTILCGSLSGLHLPSFSMNLVSTIALQDAIVITTTTGGQCVSIYTCTRMGHHLDTFTRRPGSSLYVLTTEPPQVTASAQVAASGTVAAPCSCCLLSHQTLLWHHHLGYSSLPRFRVRLQLRERFREELLVLRLHSDRGGEFSSDLLRDFCHGEGILQSFMLPASLQENGVVERRIGLVMEVARTSMIHAAAPHFL
ncbi:unnamed protein product, partial [Closterium sp. NIES-54]